MLKRSRKISQYLKGGYEDLDDIQVSFLEVAKKSEEQVYECLYPNFMDVYCSILRLGARIEVVSCLMQCTIVNRKKLPVQKAVAAKKAPFFYRRSNRRCVMVIYLRSIIHQDF